VDPDIEEEAEVPAGLKMCCIDDSGVARRLVTSQFLRFFPGSEAQAFGRSREDVPAFVEAVLSGADVVVLDQNLEWSREEVVLGTDLLQELLAKGFQGLLCMRSANSAEADVKFYRRCGAHCVINKDCAPKQFVQKISKEYHRLKLRQRPASPVPGVPSSSLDDFAGAGPSCDTARQFRWSVSRPSVYCEEILRPHTHTWDMMG
jgi:hypothetical protein